MTELPDKVFHNAEFHYMVENNSLTKHYFPFVGADEKKRLARITYPAGEDSMEKHGLKLFAMLKSQSVPPIVEEDRFVKLFDDSGIGFTVPTDYRLSASRVISETDPKIFLFINYPPVIDIFVDGDYYEGKVYKSALSLHYKTPEYKYEQTPDYIYYEEDGYELHLFFKEIDGVSIPVMVSTPKNNKYARNVINEIFKSIVIDKSKSDVQKLLNDTNKVL